MASDHSFDIASKIEPQEIINGVHQAEKDLENRFDLKDSGSKIEYVQAQSKLLISSSDEYKVKAVYEILQQKLIKRNISPKAFTLGPIKQALGGTAKQEITIQQGIPIEKAKEIVKEIKAAKLKVQAQIQGDQVRVSAKKIDDLQEVIKLVKELNLDFHVDYLNYR